MNLSTTYMGLMLRSPLVVSASPLSENIDNIKRMEDAGAAAVVLHSLFEEQLCPERYDLHYHLMHDTEQFPKTLSHFPEPKNIRVESEEYMYECFRVTNPNGHTFMNRHTTSDNC